MPHFKFRADTSQTERPTDSTQYLLAENLSSGLAISAYPLLKGCSWDSLGPSIPKVERGKNLP